MSQAPQQAKDTLFIGNLDSRVTRRLVYELCCQVCSLVTLHVSMVATSRSARGTASL